MKQEIDFSAINFNSNNDFISIKKVWWFIPLAILITVGGFLLGTVYGLVLAAFIGSYLFGKQLAEGRRKVFNKFALDNGWTFKQEVNSEDIPLGIRHMGRSRDAYDVIEGSYNGIKFLLYDYKYTVGSGKSRRIIYSTVMKLETDIHSPYILLDSRNNLAGARQTLKQAEKLELEGDFHKYFIMYVEPHNRVDGLSIISPDVMHTVMHANKTFDIEMYGNSLFLYAEGDRRNREYVKGLFSGVDAIMKEISHRAKTFKATNELTDVSKENMKSLSELYVNFSIGGKTTNVGVVRTIMAVLILFIVISSFVAVMRMQNEFNKIDNTMLEINP